MAAAAENDNIECFDLLIKHGFNIHRSAKGHTNTPLINACWHGHPKYARLLIEKGVDINISKEGPLKISPIFCAVRYGQTDCLKLLLERGAFLNVFEGQGYNLMTHAAIHSIDCISLLSDYGVSINMPTTEGATPLNMACRYNRSQSVIRLLHLGASIDDTDNRGQNAFNWALTNKSVFCLTLLLEYGADVHQLDNNGKSSIELIIRQLEVGNERFNSTELEQQERVEKSEQAKKLLDILALLISHGGLKESDRLKTKTRIIRLSEPYISQKIITIFGLIRPFIAVVPQQFPNNLSLNSQSRRQVKKALLSSGEGKSLKDRITELPIEQGFKHKLKAQLINEPETDLEASLDTVLFNELEAEQLIEL